MTLPNLKKIWEKWKEIRNSDLNQINFHNDEQ